MAIDLVKLEKRKEIVLNLTKELKLDGLTSRVILALDYSGSMGDEYANGTCQEIVERIIPLGLKFDDNQAVEFYLFHDGVIQLPEDLTVANTDGYINSKIRGKYHMGGTNYEPVIRAIMGNSAGKTITKTVVGMLSNFFGGAKKEEKKETVLPTYVIFITDGDTANRSGVEKAIREASGMPIFWSFVGIGGAGFGFLEKLDNLSGRVIDNASFFNVANIKSLSDDALYRNLMKEFPQYLIEAKNKGIL